MVLLAYADVDTSVVLLPEDVRGMAKAVGARVRVARRIRVSCIVVVVW